MTPEVPLDQRAEALFEGSGAVARHVHDQVGLLQGVLVGRCDGEGGGVTQQLPELVVCRRLPLLPGFTASPLLQVGRL